MRELGLFLGLQADNWQLGRSLTPIVEPEGKACVTLPCSALQECV